MNENEPSRAEIDALPGATVVEFGASWCGYCRALRPHVIQLRAEFPVRYINVEDGSGKPLGRSFGVKLWPTLVFLRDGKIMAKAVRPAPAEVRSIWQALVGEL